MRELTLEEVQKISLEIFTKFDEICREHNLKYFMMYGTLLGAVRHKGFIPWDDDIDVWMFREDYNKLCEILESETLKNLEVLNEKNTKYFAPMIKISRKGTLAKRKNFYFIKKLGVFIDVFPVDKVPNNKNICKIIFKIQKIIFYLQYMSINTRFKISKNRSIQYKVCKIIMFFIAKLFTYDFWIIVANKYRCFISNRSKNSKNVAFIFDGNIKDVYNIELFEKCIELDFENGKFFASQYYDCILKQYFGDYMELPPVEERVGHPTKFYEV